MAPLTNTQIDTERDDATESRNAELRLIREYDAGKQAATMTITQKKLIYPLKVQRPIDNVIRLVLNMAASHVTFTGWQVKEDPEDNPDPGAPVPADEREDVGQVSAYLSGVYMRNHLEAMQYEAHRAMFRDGDHGVSMAWRGGRARIHREPWWDGESGVFVGYDRYGDPEFAVKEWTEKRRDATGAGSSVATYRIVYYPDHFIRFMRDGGSWRPITEPTPDDAARLEAAGSSSQRVYPDGAVPWVKANGDPLGIPIMHFAYGSYYDSPYGQSDVSGILGLQDQMNAGQDDISGASRFSGFQMYWITGHESAESSIVIGPGRVLELADPASRAGVLPAGDMSQLTSAYHTKRSTVAVNTETPIHEIEGRDWPSGEAIYQARMPATDKATRAIRKVGPLWSSVGHAVTEIANVYGGMDLDESAPVTAMFDDPMRLDPLTEARELNERAKAMETISRIGDLELIRKLDFLTQKEFQRFAAERLGINPDDAVDAAGRIVAGQF